MLEATVYIVDSIEIDVCAELICKCTRERNTNQITRGGQPNAITPAIKRY
jgi:hypothetical protein